MNSPFKFTVLSTFSGCGGSSLGYQLAGGKVCLAVEIDDNAVETYRLNFPDTPIYHGDIGKLKVDEALDLAGLKPGQLDILDGSPPCQGFSTAGKRDFGDDRNQLFREYVRLLQGLQPRAFIMENVSGMVKGKMKLIFVECLKELKACGYKVKARVLNAMYYNVPQSRQRLIFIGVRDDMGIEPSHPKAQGRPITVRDALCGVPNDTRRMKIHDGLKIARKMLKVPMGQRHPKYHSYCRLPWDGPARTIDTGGVTPGYHIWHPTEHRTMTIAELQRLQSFPDAFQFGPDWKQAWKRIGNSVPPSFMRAIAEHVYETVLITGRSNA